MSRAGFGVPKFGGQGFQKTGKVEKGDKNVIRILPPMHSLASQGIWRVYRTTHWGYKGVSPRDPSKGVARPFLCILDKDRRSGLVRQECPACTSYDELKARAAEMEAELKKKNCSKDEIETAMSSINQQLKDFRSESKYYVNVLYPDGRVGDYKLNHKDHMSGINRISEGADGNGGLIHNDGINPIDPDQGVWFRIIRMGDGVNPPDTVEVEMEDVAGPGGRKLKAIKLAPLTDEQCAKAQKECPDLATRGGASLTFEQILALTKCSGDPEEVDRIMGVAKREQSAGTGASQQSKSSASTPPANTPAQQPASTSDDDDALAEALGETKQPEPYVVNGKVLTKEQYERYQAIMAQRKQKADEEAKAKADEEARKKAAEAKAKADAAKAAPAGGPPSFDPMSASDEDFMASLGDGAPA